MTSDEKAVRIVTIVNPQGLHARPAYMFAEMASQFDAMIELEKDGESIDGKSILSILTLAAGHGSQITLKAVGPDATAALEALGDLVEAGFPGEETADATRS